MNVVKQPDSVQPPSGKLGILLPGLGAVATTMIAGVMLARRGLAQPIGSLTQLGTIRLGRRTDARTPYVKDFLPLAKLDDLVFGAWDIFPDNAYEAACEANVLERNLLDRLRPELEAVRPMKGVFDSRYVKRLHGTYTKEGSKWELARQLIEEVEDFQRQRGVDRSVMVWCGSTERHMCASEVHGGPARFGG